MFPRIPTLGDTLGEQHNIDLPHKMQHMFCATDTAKAAVIYKGIILNIRRWRDNIIPVAMKLITLQVHPLHLLI
jgi:hypothetical protein